MHTYAFRFLDAFFKLFFCISRDRKAEMRSGFTRTLPLKFFLRNPAIHSKARREITVPYPASTATVRTEYRPS